MYFYSNPFSMFFSGRGRAYIFDCPYSNLCRQVVTDADGRVAEFDIDGDDYTRVSLKKAYDDAPELQLAVDSIVAVPLDEWSLDLVTPKGQCVRRAGR